MGDSGVEQQIKTSSTLVWFHGSLLGFFVNPVYEMVARNGDVLQV